MKKSSDRLLLEKSKIKLVNQECTLISLNLVFLFCNYFVAIEKAHGLIVILSVCMLVSSTITTLVTKYSDIVDERRTGVFFRDFLYFFLVTYLFYLILTYSNILLITIHYFSK